MGGQLLEKVKEIMDDAVELMRSGASNQEISLRMANLTSLLASLNSQITDAHFVFNQKKAELLKEAGSVAKAKVQAEATQEWKDFINLLNYKEGLVEFIRSIKYYLKSSIEEYQINEGSH